MKFLFDKSADFRLTTEPPSTLPILPDPEAAADVPADHPRSDEFGPCGLPATIATDSDTSGQFRPNFAGFFDVPAFFAEEETDLTKVPPSMRGPIEDSWALPQDVVGHLAKDRGPLRHDDRDALRRGSQIYGLLSISEFLWRGASRRVT
jgi:hypothetical protein